MRRRSNRQSLMKELRNFQKEYQRNKHLNNQQKDNLDNFMNRPIKFCKTGKIVHYQKERWNENKETKITNILQYNTYKILYLKLKNIIQEVEQSDTLVADEKKELNRCLQYLLGHLLGKLNVKTDF